MRVLVVGASGQVGRELCRRSSVAGHTVFAVDRSELDVCDAVAVRRHIDTASPDWVFNAAAWTAVDDAEERFDEAVRVNRDGALNLAAACAVRSIPIVHLSTDYVFDGRKRTAYLEDDAVNPINAYGRSKLAGEEAVRAAHEMHLILRTSWVFSSHRNNFVKTMLRLGSERTELRIVADQTGKPTSAEVIADVSLAMAQTGGVPWGTYHLAQPDPVSWHGFARAIFESAVRQGCTLAVKKIVAVSSDEYPTVAPRPKNSVLDCSKLENTLQMTIPDWRDALDSVIGELISDEFPA